MDHLPEMSTVDLVMWYKLLVGIVREELDYDDVAGRQIISALLKEVGCKPQPGYLYKVLQGVANEARRRHLLINPNPFSRETYSSAVGNTSRMLPSRTGWEQTKGILMRTLVDTHEQLRETMQARGQPTHA